VSRGSKLLDDAPLGVAVGVDGAAVGVAVDELELFPPIAAPTITSSKNKTTIPPKILMLLLIFSTSLYK
jgi:hypothetical protein